jgi:hypothetical protein
MSNPVPAIVPMLAGALGAIAVALLIGWPGRPPATGSAIVTAAAALAVVALLFLAGIAAAGRRPALRPARAPAPPPAARRPCAYPHAGPEPVTTPRSNRRLAA